MINFIHHFFAPHCPHCIDEKREALICNSCEILRHELEVVRLENKVLLDRILEKPVESKPIDINELKPIGPKNISWNVRRQMLEAEDREKAKLMKSTEVPTLEELEKELDVAESNRSS